MAAKYSYLSHENKSRDYEAIPGIIQENHQELKQPSECCL